MADNAFIGQQGLARHTKEWYVGVNGIARRVASAYVGVNGVARKIFPTVPDWMSAGVFSSMLNSADSSPLGFYSYWCAGYDKYAGYYGRPIEYVENQIYNYSIETYDYFSQLYKNNNTPLKLFGASNFTKFWQAAVGEAVPVNYDVDDQYCFDIVCGHLYRYFNNQEGCSTNRSVNCVAFRLPGTGILHGYFIAHRLRLFFVDVVNKTYYDSNCTYYTCQLPLEEVGIDYSTGWNTG